MNTAERIAQLEFEGHLTEEVLERELADFSASYLAQLGTPPNAEELAIYHRTVFEGRYSNADDGPACDQH